MPSTTSSWMKKTKEGVAGKGKIALDKRAQPTLAQRVAKVMAKTKWREKKQQTLAQRVCSSKKCHTLLKGGWHIAGSP
jgi:hypothetical protein